MFEGIQEAYDKTTSFIDGNLKSFGINTSIKNYVNNLLPGLTSAIYDIPGQKISTGYSIKIIYKSLSDANVSGEIEATIPKNIDLSFKSTWKAIIDKNDGGTVKNFLGLASEFATGGYNMFNNRSFSLMRYAGTDPLELDLELQLKAYTKKEAITKVIEPILKLGQLVLPELGSAGFLGSPGPGALAIKYDSESGQTKESKYLGSPGTRISCKIGDYLFLDYLIVERMSVNIPSILGDIKDLSSLSVSNIMEAVGDGKNIIDYAKNAVKEKVTNYVESKLDPYNTKLYPIRAVVKLHVKTSSAFTKDDLRKAFDGKEGNAPSFDASKLLNTATKVYNILTGGK